jgi:hypothetical protein
MAILRLMQFLHSSVLLSSLWFVVVCAVMFTTGLSSLPVLILGGAIAILPAIFMMRLSRGPAQSMSESIREGRR